MQKGKKFKTIMIIIVLCLVSLKYTRFEVRDIHSVYSLDGHLKWQFEAEHSFLFSSPCVADLDGNGLLEVLIGSLDRNLYCLDDSGNHIWSFSTEGQIVNSPSAADLDSDGKIEILIADGYNLYCLNEKGKIQWQKEISIVLSIPCIADVDNDGELDIIVVSISVTFTGSYLTTIYCLNYLGNEKWRYEINDDTIFSPCVTDLDGDGTLEILMGTYNSTLYCLDHQGNEEWRFLANETGSIKYPIAVDVDKDEKLEILFVTLDNYLYCLDNNGLEKWHFNANSTPSSPVVADIDNDDYPEILFGSESTGLFCLNYTGEIEWVFTSGNKMMSPVLADLDNDKYLEILVPSNDMVFYIINHDGIEAGNFILKNRISNSPCVADLNDDGVLEILVGAENELLCYSFPSIDSSGAFPWYCNRGSIFRTGNIDRDSDYLDDITENFYQTNQSDSDSDNDGLLDGLEVQIGLNPLVDDSDEDEDSDGLTNFEELKIYHTSIFTSDTDKDGRKDGWEVEYGSDPLCWDNWTYLFGLYFLPIYVGIIAAVIILIRRRQIKTSRIIEK